VDRRLRTRLQARFGPVLTGPIRQRHDQTEMRIRPGDVVPVLTALHDEPDFRFEFLADLCGVDTGEQMEIVYHLWSDTTPDWLRVIAHGLSRDEPRVPSLTFLWKGAEWMEREAYDMFGITFEGNRDLRRIYMPAGYTSFPLRKDFHLPDDAARSPGAGVRHMERAPHTPAEAPGSKVRLLPGARPLPTTRA
jgi:NADH-quinone oxidoreductase subunit C